MHWISEQPLVMTASALRREPIPATLAADHRFVVTKCILLLEEMLKIAQIPRVQGATTGWLAPTLGSLEMMQCITMAVSQDKRRSLGSAGKVPYQLPGTHSSHVNSQEPGLQTAHHLCTGADLLRVNKHDACSQLQDQQRTHCC